MKITPLRLTAIVWGMTVSALVTGLGSKEWQGNIEAVPTFLVHIAALIVLCYIFGDLMLWVWWYHSGTKDSYREWCRKPLRE